MVAEGHEIANHTYSHPHTIVLTRAELRQELERANHAIRVATDDVRVTRPPYGKDRRRVADVARELGLRSVLWSVDSGDTKGRTARDIAETVIRGARPGSIVLLHDGGDRRAETLQACADIIPTLQAAGYDCVTVSDLIEPHRQNPRPLLRSC
jgi:peptidoglycan/xylan/chitin deacetylase (PgdA/CDA1 family)